MHMPDMPKSKKDWKHDTSYSTVVIIKRKD